MVRDRLNKLRELMEKHQLAAYIVNGADPHMSEYAPERWKTRQFVSGFTGSAGTVVITANKAGLWTDSRYHIQGEEQLAGTGIDLFPVGVEGVPTYMAWLTEELDANSVIGCDGQCFSEANIVDFRKQVAKWDLEIETHVDLIDEIWSDRPAFPDSVAEELPVEITGASRQEKLDKLWEVTSKEVDYHLFTALDDVAWVLNLRGTDVAFNPVWMGYLLIGRTDRYIFANSEKLTPELSKKLKDEGFTLHPYDAVFSELKQISANKTIAFDSRKVNRALIQSLADTCCLKDELSKIAMLKACKNDTEVDGFKKAMVQDGTALVNFLYWLDHAIGSEEIDEYTIREKLLEFRSVQPDFRGESFPPIVGYADHGAIVHYSVTPESANQLEANGLLLFDSGGQYSFGTTDITRTVAQGELSAEMRRDFTLVLKGMINLSNAVFPKNTRGYHLDVLARQALWQNGLNYGHGTGHGVGHFLSVHEGPMSIRQEFNDIAIEPGMVLSNEPGVYHRGKYGIRIENLINCQQEQETEYGKFYRFDTLTLCPIDRKCIDKSMLSESEKEWLNQYHQKVYVTLKEQLNEPQKEWLLEATQPI